MHTYKHTVDSLREHLEMLDNVTKWMREWSGSLDAEDCVRRGLTRKDRFGRLYHGRSGDMI